jgi:peptidyl-prolyl cis-trans isomerase SurA
MQCMEGLQGMKKILAGSILMILMLSTLGAQVIDQPVARVKLTKTDIIYQARFIKFVEKYEKQLNKKITIEEKKQVLDKLIEEKLLIQAAQQDKISASQGEIDAKIKQFKQLLEYQEGKTYSDDDFRKYITSQSEITWDEFIETIKNSILQQNYLMAKKGDEIKGKAKAPTEDEIEAYYKDNQKSFIAPEMLKFKQIVVLTKGKDDDTKKKSLERVKEIYKELQKGGAFDNYNEVYVKGITQQMGALYIETWQRDDEQRKTAYGANFFNSIFKLNEGALSDIIESNVGYHIVQVIKKYPFSVLGLEDKIPPQYTQTVREKVKEGLVQKKEYDALQGAYVEMIAELKKKADIKIFEDKLTW